MKKKSSRKEFNMKNDDRKKVPRRKSQHGCNKKPEKTKKKQKKLCNINKISLKTIKCWLNEICMCDSL